MSQLDEVWDETVAQDFGEVDPGPYQVRIDKAVLNNAKKEPHRLQVSWEWTVVNGPFTNRKIWKHTGLDDDQGRGIFRGDIERIGVSWPPAPVKDNLPPLLEGLIGTYMELKVVEKKDRNDPNQMVRFINFVKALDDSEVVDETGGNGDAPLPPAQNARAPARGATPAPQTAPAAGRKPGRPPAQPAPAPAPAPAPDPDSEVSAEDQIEFTFGEKDFDRATTRRLHALATEQQFNPADYAGRNADLLADVAELLGGMGGAHDDAKALLELCEQAAEETAGQQ